MKLKIYTLGVERSLQKQGFHPIDSYPNPKKPSHMIWVHDNAETEEFQNACKNAGYILHVKKSRK